MIPLATRIAFGKEIVTLGQNHDFLVVNADTKACQLEEFKYRFPEREISLGIAEQNMMTVAAGMASCGDKVIVSTFAVFASMRACEQVRTFICYPRLNVTIAGTHTGLQVGADGATHAAIEDVAIMNSFPNMTVIQPSDAISATAAAHAAIAFKGPLYVRLHRNPVNNIHSEGYKFRIGQAEPIIQYGTDAAILVTGILLHKAIAAAAILRTLGIEVCVIEFPTIKPLNQDAVLSAAQKCGAVVTVEDHSIYGGFGSCVASLLSQKYPIPVRIIGIQDRFAESGDPELLYQENFMSEAQIVQAVRETILMKPEQISERIFN